MKHNEPPVNDGLAIVGLHHHSAHFVAHHRLSENSFIIEQTQKRKVNSCIYLTKTENKNIVSQSSVMILYHNIIASFNLHIAINISRLDLRLTI